MNESELTNLNETSRSDFNKEKCFEEDKLITQRQRPKAGQKQEKEEKKWVLRSESPPPLRDNTVVPYKTIFFTFFLLFSGILLVTATFLREEAFQEWGGYFQLVLGIMLMIPGVYYGGYIILIWLGIEDFEYENLPQLDMD